MPTYEVVALGGRRTLRDPDEIRDALFPAWQERQADVVVLDLRGVHHVPTSAYGILSQASRGLRDHGRKLHVVSDIPELRAYLDNEGVCDIYGIPVFETLEDAHRRSPIALREAFYDRFNAVPETLGETIDHFDADITTFESSTEELARLSPPGTAFQLDDMGAYSWPLHAFQIKMKVPEIASFASPDHRFGLETYEVLRFGLFTWPIRFEKDDLNLNISREWLVFDETIAVGQRLITAATFFGTENGRVGPPIIRPPFTKAHPLFEDFQKRLETDPGDIDSDERYWCTTFRACMKFIQKQRHQRLAV